MLKRYCLMINNERANLTFAICAYKESEYLESCIRSIKKQTISVKVIMTTSTPCEFIHNLANKYQIPLYVREGKSDIRDDWNFAYNHADTDWVTIAHQDDLYAPTYAEEFQKRISRMPDSIMFITDYIPIRHNMIRGRDINSVIRRLLRTPLKSKSLCRRKFWKRAVLCLGNAICCPTVSYNKQRLGASVFTSPLKYNIDWDTFVKLADVDGAFVYADKPLTFYRVHSGSTSKEWIENHMRERDDQYMFRKFWPEWMVKIIMLFYKKAYDTYD